MKYNPRIHHRRSIRLKGYDYHKEGAYFVTICTKDRIHVLNDPVVNEIVFAVWLALPKWFPAIELDEFVIMPNHVHFIVWIVTEAFLADAPLRGGGMSHYKIPEPKTVNLNPTLGDIVGAFKSLVFTVYLDWIEKNDPSRRAKFWQGNYYEHIVRNHRELNAIRQYIIDNPVNWEKDRDNPGNIRKLPPPEKIEEYLQDVEEFLSFSNEE